jgi:hypothetical protein
MTDRGDRLARNEALFRSVNERVEEVVQPGNNEEIDFLCECGDSECVEKISLTRSEYERVRADSAQFAIAVGHEIPDIEDVVTRTDRFLAVRKQPEESAIARETDPRS